MDRDSFADLPADSRREIVAAVCALLDVEAATAEDLVRSAEPLWEAMERAGGLVDSWGGASSATSSRASWRSFGRVRWAADCCRSVRCTASCSDATKRPSPWAERAMVVNLIDNADATPVRPPRTGGLRGQAHQ